MKIVQLVYHLGAGGAEKFVTDLSNELAERGHEVVVLMLRDDTVPEFGFNLCFLDPSVRVRSLRLRTGAHPAQVFPVCKALDQERPDVVHAHLGVLPFIYIYSLIHKEIRFIHTVHSIPSFDIRYPMLRRLAGFFYKRTITPVSISQTCSNLFRKCYGFSAETIENGRAVPEKSEKYNQVVQELAPMPRPLFVHVARFAPEKNQALLLESFSKLELEGTAFTLLIIGSGFAERPEFSRFSGDRIRFLGPKSNVCDYLRLADAFCLSSRIEGSPISLIEAFACGATPICTPAGGIPDLVRDGETGYLSPGFEVRDYLEAIRSFFRHPIPRENLVLYYQAHFTMERCASDYLKLYNKR